MDATSENTEKTKPIPKGLIPFKKGQSGNPGGRPKGAVSVVAHLKRLLAENKEKEAAAVAKAWISHAKSKYGAAQLKELVAHVDGHAVEKQAITADIHVVYEVDL